jgi:hypothetical protein
MIEYHEDQGRGGGAVRTVACPFCGTRIDGNLPHHLRVACEATQAARGRS